MALGGLPPFSIVLARVGLAALALLLALHGIGQRLPRNPRLWAAFLAMGALNNLLPFSLIVWGQTQIPSGLASILNATTPLWTVLLAHLLTSDEKLTANRMVGVGAGLLGVMTMVGPTALDGIGLNLLAQLACLIAAGSYACAGIFGRRFRERGVSPLVSATGQVVASTVMLVPVALLVDRPWTLPMPGLVPWTAVVAMALFCTALAYVIYFRILAAAGAINLLLVTFLIPVNAILLGSFALAEHIQPQQLGGMVLIAVGLAAIDGRLPALLSRLLRLDSRPERGSKLRAR
ncbi:MAG: DMT family transporter [Geminicoccaceae bacterium]